MAGPAPGSIGDRTAGTLVGLAAGDALGAGYEFDRPPDGHAEMIGGGLGPWAPGEWTDDTQMALCVAEAGLDLEAIGRRFLLWYDGRPRDVGVQTAAVLAAADGPDDLAAQAARHYARYPKRAAGNGSLMRTAPVALACLGDDDRIATWARAVSELTHADPLTGDACVLWCVAIDRAIREERLDGARDGLALIDEPARGRWQGWLDEAESAPPSRFNPNGFVVTALQAAHAAVTQTPVPTEDPGRHLHDALQTAVAIGNDTDTVGAIAGALLGARWGASAVPERWRSVLHGWPGYRADALVRVALALSG